MKLGVLTALFQDQSLEKALDIIAELGLEAVEIGTGNFVGDAHCNPSLLLEDEKKLKDFKRLIEEHNLFISALSCHGNPLHPDESFAKKHRKTINETILLAERLGVDRINCFAGCPGASDSDKYPNWVTCPWPPYYSEIIKWQWEKKIIPYWKETAKFAREHKVKICLEMHPGDAVYCPEKLLKLREAAGEEIGCNFDPSHLFWQGIDPIAAARKLGDAIYHVHAKDTRIDPLNCSVNGVLDTKPYSDEINRSWIFRTVGYGHSDDFWKDFVSTLRLVGYDYVLSIEHEDSLMSAKEGLEKAVKFLKGIILREKLGKMWWA